MEMIERHRFSPSSEIFARHFARLGVFLPELAAAQAEFLHRGNRVLERPIAEAVALDAAGRRRRLHHRGEQAGRGELAELAAAQRLAGGGTYDCRFGGFHSITRSSSALM